MDTLVVHCCIPTFLGTGTVIEAPARSDVRECEKISEVRHAHL